MKKLSLATLALVAASALSTMSCKKSNSTTDPNTGNNSQDAQNMTAFMQAHGPQFENFTIDATAGASITSSKGIKYTIPAGAFVTSTGAAVTGSVTVAVKEITTPSDMILGDKPTLTRDGRLMLSYGEFFVKATQNDQNLLLKKDSAVKVQVPAKPAANGVGQEVPMWAGDSSISYTLSGYDYLNTAVTISVQAKTRRGITWDQIPGYAFFNSSNGTLDFKLDSLIKWRNCDAIISNSDPKTTFLGYFNSNYNPLTSTDYQGDQPTSLYFKPHNQNTLVKLYDIILNATGSHQGFISYENAMPIGMQGTFLAMSTVNGKFYADMKDGAIGTPSGSNNYTTMSFDPVEVSESTMVSMILSLNSK